MFYIQCIFHPSNYSKRMSYRFFHCIFVVPVRSLDPDNGKVPRSRKNKGIPVHSPTTWMFCFFFLPTSPQKKARNVGNLGENSQKLPVWVGYWSLNFSWWKGALSEDWRDGCCFFSVGSPLFFNMFLCGITLTFFFSSCFQSSYKHPQIRKITPCKVVTMKHGGHLSSGQLENKLGGLYILFISRSNSTKPPSTQNIKQFEHLLETWKSLIHSCTTRRNPRRLTMIRRKKQLNLGTPQWF